MKKRRFLLALGLTISALTLASCGINQDSGVTGNGNNQPSNQEGTQGQGATASQGQPSQSQGANQTQAEPVVLGNINITKSAGDQESVYLEWQKLQGVSDYNVYYKKSSASSYTKVDKQLIREYSSNYRADIVGIEAGLYDVKVVPVVDSQEQASYETVVSNLTAISYDRTGFAFSASAMNPEAKTPGAYNANGTLKDDARVIYVSKDNAKTVTLDIKTSKSGTEDKVGLQAILSGYEKGLETRPLAIRFIGKVSKEDLDSVGSSGEGLQIKGKNSSMANITLEGIGNDATISGFGFLVRACTSIEIRNLGFMTKMDDDVSLDTDNFNIWVHDNDFFYGAHGSGDHAKGDGALDIKGTLYATLSYNHFWDTGKTTLNSNGDQVDYVSYHHNWYDHSDSRHPRVRMSSAIHVYNNYFDGVSKYGIGAAEGSTSVFSENNYYRNCKYPMLSSLQGSDVYGGTTTYHSDYGTFSNETGGVIKSYGDKFVGTYTFIPYGASTYVNNGVETAYDLIDKTTSATASSTVHFDAYVAQTRDEQVPATVTALSGGSKYSNFDTNPSIMYQYQVQTPDAAVDTIKNYSGRVEGGDLKWEFDNATEDTNYAVIPGLRSAIDNYVGTVVRVLGINGSSQSSETPITPEPTTPTESTTPVANVGASYKKTFDNGVSDTVFTIIGSLKSDVASKTYDGVTYTSALKMEKSTSITFTLDAAYTLVIVTDSSSKKIKIDDNNKTTDSNGVYTIDLASGSHTITKGDSMNVYALILIKK